MEFTREEFLKVGCNLNKLNIEQESRTSKLVKKIKRHKFLTTVIIALIIFSSLNIAMIYSFMKVLQNI